MDARRPATGADAGPPPAWVVDALRAAGCVFAEQEAAILVEADRATDRPDLPDLVRRRTAGQPLEHLVGWVEFLGRRVVVDDGVFVPRRRSELMVRVALTHLAECADPAPVVVDVCCGSGAIGRAIADAVPGVDLHAADVDPAAVRCAIRNLAPVGGNVYRGDLFDPLRADLAGRVQVLTANAPYVPTAAIALMPPEARDHEPAVALDGGVDGTEVLRRIVAGAPGWLAGGGIVVVEIGRSQMAAITAALAAAGLEPRIVVDDGVDGLVAVGRRPAPP